MDSNSTIDAHQNLPEWVSKFDKKFLSKLDLKERGHQYFNDTYKACFNIRNDFRNNFLPKLESDLGFPSLPKYYKYEYFFRTQEFPEFELSNNYYYDNDLNLLKKNYSSTNINKKETNNENLKNIKKKTNDKSFYNNNYQNSYKNYKENKKEEEKVNIVNKSYQIKKEKDIIGNNNNKNYLKDKKANSNTNINYDNKINNNNINNNQSYKRNEINYTFQKDEPKIQNKNIENKKGNGINKNSIVIKNETLKRNNKENKNEKLIKSENIYTKNIEKESKIDKKNIPNSANKIKINKIYNKNIIPIIEVSNENDEETPINMSKSSQKNPIKVNRNIVVPQSPNIIKIKAYYNSPPASKSQKEKEINNNINKNIIYTKTPINRISNENQSNSSKNTESLKSSTKRGSIKNYLLEKKSNLHEDGNKCDETPKLKAADNMNHSRIKNYLRNKNNEEDEKVGELGISRGKRNYINNN